MSNKKSGSYSGDLFVSELQFMIVFINDASLFRGIIWDDFSNGFVDIILILDVDSLLKFGIKLLMNIRFFDINIRWNLRLNISMINEWK